jgi:hypothetical protein
MVKIPKGFVRRRPRPKLSKPKAREVAKIARKVMRSNMETKTVGKSTENEQLFHNKPLYQGGLLATAQGTGDPNNQANANARIGDEILLRNVNVRFWLSNKLDRPNCMYKLFLFWYTEGQTLSDTLCFFTQGNKMLDRINNENISIIDHKTVFSKEMYLNGTEKFEHSQLCTLNGNWKGKKIIYDQGGATPKKRNIGFCVVVYDAYGTLQTDNIASLAYDYNTRFQDP